MKRISTTRGICSVVVFIIAVAAIVITVGPWHGSTPQKPKPAHNYGQTVPGAVAITKAVPSSIPSSCPATTDDTNALQAWLDGLPAGSASQPVVVQFAYKGCYLVNGSLDIRGFQDYTFDGNGATISETSVIPDSSETGSAEPPPTPTKALYCGSSTTYDSPDDTNMGVMFWFEGGCDLTVRNFNFAGSWINTTGSQTYTDSASPKQDSLIQLNGVQRATIVNNTFGGAWGDWITTNGLNEPNGSNGGPTYGGPAGAQSSDITVEDNTMHSAMRQGISPVYVNRMNVTNNTMLSGASDGVGYNVLDIEADGPAGSETDINFTNNTVGNLTAWTDQGINSLGQYGYLLSFVSSNLVRRVNFSHNTIDGPFKVLGSAGSGSSDLNFKDNIAKVAWVNPSAAFGLGTISNVNIEGNSTPVPLSPLSAEPFVATNYNGSSPSNEGIVVQNNALTNAPSSQNLVYNPYGAPVTVCGNTIRGGTLSRENSACS